MPGDNVAPKRHKPVQYEHTPRTPSWYTSSLHTLKIFEKNTCKGLSALEPRRQLYVAVEI